MTTMSTDQKYTLDHETDEQETLPAMPGEHEKFAIDMTKLQEFTIRPGLLRLPVHDMRPAENSPQVVIELDHPVIEPDDLRYFIAKPAYWDPTAFEWCQLLDWYGYTPRDQHELRTDRLYVKYDRHTETWDLSAPPSPFQQARWRWSGALKTQLPGRLRPITSMLSYLYRATFGKMRRSAPRRRTSIVTGTGMLAFGCTLMASMWMLTDTALMNTGVAALTAIGVGLVTMLLAAIAVEPPEGYT